MYVSAYHRGDCTVVERACDAAESMTPIQFYSLAIELHDSLTLLIRSGRGMMEACRSNATAQ